MADSVQAMLRRAQESGRAGQPQAPPTPAGEDEAVDEYLAYAKLRSPRSVAFMLELRLAAGDSDALDYGYLLRAQFNPSKGIVLRFGGVTVTIKGRKLRPLYEAVRDHRATWVQETDSPPAEAVRDPDQTLVTGIEIDPD